MGDNSRSNVERLIRKIWEGQRKYITLFAIVAFVVGLIYMRSANPIAGALFSLLSAVAISMFFDLTTRESVRAEIKQSLEEYLNRIIVPHHQHLKKPFQEFLVHLNRTSIPYEERRETLLYFNELDQENQVIRMDVVTKILFDESQLQGSSFIRRKFEMPLPLKEIEFALGVKATELENNAKVLKNLIPGIRSTFVKGVKLGNQKVDDLSEILRDEDVELIGNQLIYKGEFLFPVCEIKDNTTYHLELTLLDVESLTDEFIVVFKTFCREFICQINFDNQVLATCDRRPEEVLKLTPITFKGIGAYEGYARETITQRAIRAYCKNLLPGSVFLVEWDFTPSSSPTP